MHSPDYHRFGILKLTPNNYHVWRQKTQLILTKERLWHVVRDTPPQEKDLAWIEKDEMASACIGLLVEDQYLVDVRDQPDAHTTWEHLSKLYGQRNMQTRMTLNKSLFTARYQSGSDMMEHLAQMMDISSRLRDLGHPLDEPLMCSALLCSLPAEYGTLITTIEINSDTSLSIEAVRSMIMEEANRHRINKEENHSPNSALAVNTRMYRPNRVGNGECFYCHKVGHLKKDCRLRKRHEAHLNLEDPPNTYSKPSNPQETTEYSKSIGNYTGSSQKTSTCEALCCMASNTPKIMTVQYRHPNYETPKWIIDTGACEHMCNDPSLLTRYTTSQEQRTFVTADGSVDVSVGVGEYTLSVTTTTGIITQLRISPVFCLPKLTDNLISINALDSEGFTTHFQSGKAFIQKDSEQYLLGEKDHHLYRTLPILQEHAKSCIHTWHNILGHPNYKDLDRTINLDKETSTNIQDCHPDNTCHTCVVTKLSDGPFKTKLEPQTKEIFEMLHSDIIGPISPTSIGNNSFILTIIDDYSRYSSVYPIKRKSDANKLIKSFIIKHTQRLNRAPSRFRSDGGGEFCNNELRTFLQERGIKHEVTVPHSPQQNGRAERYNRTLFSNIRAIIKTSRLPKYLWGEISSTANYLNNLVMREGRSHTPFEAWFHKPPSYTHLHTIGAQCVYLNTDPNRHKMDDRGMEGVLVGYGESTKIYRIWNTQRGNIVHSRRVVFYDDPCEHCQIENSFGPTNHLSPEEKPGKNSDTNNIGLPPPVPLRRSNRINMGKTPKLLTYDHLGESHQETPDWYQEHDLSPLGGV